MGKGRREVGAGRSPTKGYAASGQPGGGSAALEDDGPDAVVRPMHGKAATFSAVVGRLRRSMMERAGAGYLLRRQSESRAKGVSRFANVAG